MKILLLFAGLSFSASVSAAEYWVTAGDGAYDDIANWTSQVPDASTDVIFNQNISYTVTLPATGSWVTGTVTVEQGDLSFDLGGNSLEVSPPSVAGPTFLVGTLAGSPATLTLANGNWTLQANSGFDLGTVAGSSGTLNLSSSNVSFTDGLGFTSIGEYGDGNINITNGAQFTLANATEIAEKGGSSGSVIVDGAGSSLSSGNSLEVGNAGNAYLAVRNGASVTLGSSGLRMSDYGGTGVADVSGAGSLLRAPRLMIANHGTATLNIFDGGLVETTSVDTTLAWNGGGSGTVNVSDGGELRSSDLALTRGHSGTALLNIATGGLVDNHAIVVYVDPWDPWGQTIEVETGTLAVNEGGTLHLNGGTLDSHIINATGELGFGGPGNFVFDAGLLIVNTFIGDLTQSGGVFSPGHPLRLTEITGDYDQAAAASFAMEIGGTIAGSQYDKLIVGGTATLAGSLDVSLLNGFAPAPGDSFDALTADTIVGDFSSYQLPALTGGAGWRSRILPDEYGATDALQLSVENIVIDFDPWSAANEIRPKDAYFFGLMIKTTSVADGDPYDFDASTVDAASLRAGPAGAQNIAVTVLTADYDQDGDTDYIYAFRVQETGLTCTSSTIMVTGSDLGGNPIGGSDSIVPIQCEEIATIDVDPFNAANEVRPNDSYTVPVAIMSTSVASGEPADIDATQVDPASLKFGPNQVPHTGSIVTTDLDGDADADVVFGFNAYDSGIACGDSEMTVEGELYDTTPIIGMDAIATIDCDTGACHP